MIANHYAAAFVAIFALHVPFPYIVLAAGVIGYLGGRIAPEKFKAGGGHGASDKSFGPAIIDDHTPAPNWARFTWRSTLVHVAVGLGLWILAEGFLYLSIAAEGLIQWTIGIFVIYQEIGNEGCAAKGEIGIGSVRTPANWQSIMAPNEKHP